MKKFAYKLVVYTSTTDAEHGTNALGEQGWELIDIRWDAGWYAWFKRESNTGERL